MALRLLEWSSGQLAAYMEDHLTGPAEKLPPPVARACTLIRTRFDQPLSLGQVAAAVGVSREHFCTMFHKSTGLRVVEYLTRVRVERAGELLRSTDDSITKVALQRGFQSVSRFNRRFRAMTGKTPTEYRGEGEAQRVATAGV